MRKKGLGGSSPRVSDNVLDRALRVVVERAVILKRRVEQKVMKVAIVSLLALFKERKERPDPPPWTPLFTTRALPRTTSPTRATGDQTNDHCQVPHHGAPPSSDGQVPSWTLTPSSFLNSAARVQ